MGAIDLNLLVVFDAVMQERSVTRAGHRLGLSQSAISHALTRLRHALKDELFIRSPKGMIPTPRAEHLALPVQKALDGLLRSLEPPEFDPAQATRNFKVAVDNYAAIVLVGPLAARIAKLAPQVMLEFYPSARRNVDDLLDRNELDLAIGPFPEQAERFASQPLINDQFVAVLRRNHPAVRSDELSVEDIARLPHLEISSAHLPVDSIDDALARRKLVRRIALRAPLLSAIRILLGTDLVCMLPLLAATELVRNRSLVIRHLRQACPAVTSTMAWPRWHDNQPAHRWLRENVRLVAKDIRPE